MQKTLTLMTFLATPDQPCPPCELLNQSVNPSCIFILAHNRQHAPCKLLIECTCIDACTCSIFSSLVHFSFTNESTFVGFNSENSFTSRAESVLMNRLVKQLRLMVGKREILIIPFLFFIFSFFLSFYFSSLPLLSPPYPLSLLS